MHKFSALFHKRPKDRKHKDSSDLDEDTCSCPHDVSSDSSGSFRSPPRLLRSPALRPSRYLDEAKPPVLSVNGTDNSGEPPGFRSASNLSSRYSNGVQTGSPLPSPPRSPAQAAIQATSYWPLPSPRQHPKKHEESRQFERLENGHERSSVLDAGWSEGDRTRHFQGLPSPSGTPVASPRIGGMVSGSLGAGPDSHAGAVPSTPNGRLLRAVRNPGGSVPQEESWHWAPEQASDGDNRVIDEFSGPDYSARSEYQNGGSSRHTGHSSHHSHKVGTPNTASPPLSPSAARTSSSGGWIKGHLLGSGAFGKVYKGINSETGEFCAIKEVEFVQNDARSRESANQLEKEISSLSSLHHPNIVQYKGSEVVGNSLYIYLELVSGGSLYKLYQEFKKLEEPVIRRYTRQILLGLHFLHSRKFVHRDIKCANILVDQDGTVKLADFGVAKYIKEQGVPFSMKGSPHWMAPEVIMSKNTGFEYGMDIWSLGCTVIEMATGKPPWGGLEAAAVMFKVIKMGAPPVPESLSPEGQSFVRLCLQKNPGNRPTALALLTHPFVQIQKDGQDSGTVHTFGANALDSGEAYASASALNMHPSLSAPSSPQSSHPGVGNSYAARSDLVLHQKGKLGDSSTENWEQEPFERASVLPQVQRKSNHTRKKSPGVSRPRHRSSELPRGRAWPSLSEPASPNSTHSTYMSLHPTRSAEVLPSYEMPFSQHRKNQQGSPRMSKGFGHARLSTDRQLDESWRLADGNRF